MGAQPISPDSGVLTQGEVSTSAGKSNRHRMSTRNRLLFFLVAWLIVLMPLLFWWSTWFGRQLSDQQIGEYLRDDKHPRHIQHALVQIAERLQRHDAAAASWQGDLIRLASHPVEDIRNTDAWVMGQDTDTQSFHDTLRKMLGDSSLTVRGNAALSLVRFGDATGRTQIVALLQPATIRSAGGGQVVDVDQPGTSIHQNGLIAKIRDAQTTTEIRSPIGGRVQKVRVAAGAQVASSTEIATIEPSDDQVWEALRALYLIGQTEDLPAVRSYQREVPGVSDRVRQQAILTDKAIQERARR
jgi:hypothetical protein